MFREVMSLDGQSVWLHFTKKKHICSAVVCNSASVCVQRKRLNLKKPQQSLQSSPLLLQAHTLLFLLQVQAIGHPLLTKITSLFFLFFLSTCCYKPQPFTIPSLFIAWLYFASAFLELHTKQHLGQVCHFDFDWALFLKCRLDRKMLSVPSDLEENFICLGMPYRLSQFSRSDYSVFSCCWHW